MTLITLYKDYTSWPTWMKNKRATFQSKPRGGTHPTFFAGQIFPKTLYPTLPKTQVKFSPNWTIPQTSYLTSPTLLGQYT